MKSPAIFALLTGAWVWTLPETKEGGYWRCCTKKVDEQALGLLSPGKGECIPKEVD
jgi:hypothetical protein